MDNGRDLGLPLAKEWSECLGRNSSRRCFGMQKELYSDALKPVKH